MDEFKTSDINLAACLRLNHHEMKRIELCGNKGTFVFDNIRDDILNDFDLGKCLVEPVSFNNMIKQLTTSVRRMTQQQ